MKTQGMRGIGDIVFWQAHRGGGGLERPDNTLVSCRYGWELGGIVELDIRKTLDGQIVCLHDPTLRRTTDAPDAIADTPVTGLAYESFRHVDAGRAFDAAYAGEHVPLLTEVFSIMAADQGLHAYLDLKNIDLSGLARMIARFGLEGRIWVSGPRRSELEEIKRLLPTVDTMQWLGGSGADIMAKFMDSAAAGFAGLGQIQIHLNDDPGSDGSWRYTVGRKFIEEALVACASAGVDLEVFPWHFADSDIHALLDAGLRWFATDEPSRFHKAVTGWLETAKER